MKQRFVTIGVAVAILAAVVVINQFRPDRMTEAEKAERAELQKIIGDEDQHRERKSIGDSISEAAKNGDLKVAQAAEEKKTGPISEGAMKSFKVKFDTTNGDFVVECYPDWAPIGVARFKEAVEAKVFDDCAIFRVLPGFVIQFGIPGIPAEAAKWKAKTIKDDPVKQSNTEGMLTFATAGKDTRTTQLFVNLASNKNLDGMGFAPFGKVVEGMDVVKSMEAKYQGAPSDDQMAIQAQGNEFLKKKYPDLDYITRARVVTE
ncbi:MAG: peptidylprolyl isomerase [Candidatus Hydrogenedentota bacterium]